MSLSSIPARRPGSGRFEGAPVVQELPAVTYEQHSGAAGRSLPSAYRRREPEKSVLYTVIRKYLEAFLRQAALPDGEGYPRFVEHEFRRYLDCGQRNRGKPFQLRERRS